ncbi:hypothetical protein L1987_38400 [Smallanthus sonchifolius]|uniref:Uncharacterized protein n=1 Tax=Smallanthus sonchifolius TaxID=185202 RepID=A0ACB9HIJ5_9ASTR|nr:hypothetical protein L1987_38400 [Smallanthus sonchifolius]
MDILIVLQSYPSKRTCKFSEVNCRVEIRTFNKSRTISFPLKNQIFEPQFEISRSPKGKRVLVVAENLSIAYHAFALD